MEPEATLAIMPMPTQRRGVIGRLLSSLVLGGFLGAIGPRPLVATEAALPPRLNLTDGERVWLAEHPNVRVGFDPALPPFSFTNDMGKLDGIDWDYLHRIAAMTGINFIPSPSNNWSEALEKGRRREVDLICSAARSDERDMIYAFTEPYMKFAVVIITRKDAPLVASISALHGRSIAVERNTVTVSWLLGDDPDATLVLKDTFSEALAAVAQGDAFACVGSLANAGYVIRLRGITNLKVTGVLPRIADFRFAVRKDWPELASILDKAIAAVPAAERQAIIEPWVRIEYEGLTRWEVVWRIAGAILALSALVVLGFYLRSRRLARDLSERVRLQREVEEARDRLARLNEEKSTLLNMVAHDLRNPLTAFLLGVESLRWSPALNNDPTARATTDVIADQIGRMRRLVDNLLDMQELEEGRRTLRREPIEVARVLQEAVMSQMPAAGRKSITIDLSRVAAAPCIVPSDAGALRQVIDNLISNAVKYTRLGGRIEVTLRADAKHVRLEVRDEGPGIAVEDRPKLFGKFGRLKAQPTAGESSHGLGLFIVKHLVTALGGRIWCEGAAEQGAIFVVELPAG